MKNLLLILTLIFAATAFDCGNQTPTVVPPSADYVYTTPRGVNVRSVMPIEFADQEKVFKTIDVGIQLMLTSSQIHNPTWEKAASHSDYRLLLVSRQATNQDGSPAILVSGIQSAGTVLGIDGDGYDGALTLVIPHQSPDWGYLNYLRDTARHEGEHYREWQNDREIFKRLAVRGDVHPHWKLEGE